MLNKFETTSTLEQPDWSEVAEAPAHWEWYKDGLYIRLFGHFHPEVAVVDKFKFSRFMDLVSNSLANRKLRTPANSEQRTPLEHAVRVAQIAKSDMQMSSVGVLAALSHECIDGVEPEIAEEFLGNVASIFPNQNGEGSEVAQTIGELNIWMDYLEEVGEISHLLEQEEKLAPFARPEKAQKALASLPNTLERVASLVPDLKNYKHIESIQETLNDIATGNGDRKSNYIKLLMESQLLTNRKTARNAVLILTANIIDGLRYPKKASDSGNGVPLPPSMNIANNKMIPVASASTMEDVIESIFFRNCLEMYHPKALKALKEGVYPHVYPREYSNLWHAVREVNFAAAYSELGVLVGEVENYFRYRGANIVSPKDFEGRWKQALSMGVEAAESKMPYLLKPEEICITTHREKSLASILDKLMSGPSKYEQAMIQTGAEVPERFSYEWFKKALEHVPDYFGIKVIFHQGDADLITAHEEFYEYVYDLRNYIIDSNSDYRYIDYRKKYPGDESDLEKLLGENFCKLGVNFRLPISQVLMEIQSQSTKGLYQAEFDPEKSHYAYKMKKWGIQPDKGTSRVLVAVNAVF